MRRLTTIAATLALIEATTGCQSGGPVRKAVTKHTAAALHEVAAQQQIRETHPAEAFPIDVGERVAQSQESQL